MSRSGLLAPNNRRNFLASIAATLLLAACPPLNPQPDAGATFTLGGTVTGLTGSGLVLQNNLGDDLAITANGPFIFPTSLPAGTEYIVTVKTQPKAPAQICQALNYTGKIADANVTTISVTCTYNAYFIGGTVTGLAGAGLVLQNNVGDDITITANGTFTFATPIVAGGGYSVSVKAQPTAPSQTCVVTNPTGTVTSSSITNIAVTCTTNTYAVGGTITGLLGAGLILRNNGTDEIPASTDGSFIFAIPVASGNPYSVTVETQPTVPNQTCLVTNGTGTVTSGSITDIAVTCTTNTYTIGGTVTGLTGVGLVLRNSGSDDLVVTANGAFAFSTALPDLSFYAVTVLAQPTSPSQRCLITNDSGTLSGNNVTNVTVNCRYAISGTISGLAGNGLVLQNNGTDDLAIASNGVFTFTTPISSGSSYVVTVKTQPTSPPQSCAVTNGAGWVDTSPVTNIAVACITLYSLGGTVSGFTSGLVLASPGMPDFQVPEGASAFTFANPMPTGTTYAVTAKTPPPSASCTIANASGTIAGADVTNIAVYCARPWTSISAGHYHSFATTSDGTLWTWGYSSAGVTDGGFTPDRLSPVPIDSGFGTADAASYYSLAVKSDGTLWAWGNNYSGQLGDGTTTSRTTPEQVGTQFTAIAADFQHSAGVKTDGSLWTWGWNNCGQIGDGTRYNNRLSPFQVGTGFTSVAVGECHTTAVKADGTRWAWGQNGWGELGDGTTAQRLTPVQVGIDFATVATGYRQNAGIKTDGTLWTWGRNESGQLGDGTTTDRLAPVQIGTGFAKVSVGCNHALAVKADGTLWAWGDNAYGQLGDGTTTQRLTPIQVGTGFAKASAGCVYSMALKLDGTLWTWGRNENGQLGDGTTTNRVSPVQIP